MQKSKTGFSLNAKKALVTKKFFGATGTEIYGGYISEDYIENLNGAERSEIFEKMRRGDAQISKILSVIKGPIKGAQYEFEPSGDTDLHYKAAEFCRWNWLENPYIDFDKFIGEQLTMLDFGCSIHEYAFTFYDHAEFKQVHILGGLGFRKQSTIHEWNMRGGVLEYVTQIAYGDSVDGKQQTHNLRMPVSTLMINVNNMEGDNFEGISLLRPCFGPWSRKNTYLQLVAIGMEKAAIGTPIGKYPAGAENKDDKENFKNSLLSLSANEQNFIMMPDDYQIEIIKNTFDADKMKQAIDYEDGQIAGAALVSFLELGKSGGAYALSNDLSDIALLATKHVGKSVTKAMRKPTRALCEMNFGDANLAPNIKVVGIDKKAGKEFAEVVNGFISSGVIRVDDKLESYIRKSADLPAAETTREDDEKNGVVPMKPSEPKTKEEKPEIEENEGDEKKESKAEKKDGKEGKFSDDESGFRPFTIYEATIDFAELVGDFDSEELKLKNLMMGRLTAMVTPLMKDFSNRLKNRSGSRADVAKQTSLEISGYTKSLVNEFNRQMKKGVETGRRDLRTKLQANFAEEKAKFPELISATTKDAIEVQALAQAQTHKQEIEKIIMFGTVNADANVLTDAQLTRELELQIDEFIKSKRVASAARIITSQNINKARAALFNSEGVRDQIQALQYSAVIDTRTTPICRSLDGQIFSMDRKANFTFTPPNHFGCRSILVPITVNEPKPKLTELKPVKGTVTKGGKELSINDILASKNLSEVIDPKNFL